MALINSTNIYSNSRYIVDNVTQGSPYTTIQSAIDAAVADGGNATVYVRQGTYTEDLTLYSTVSVAGQAASLAIINGTHTPPAAGRFHFQDVGLKSATHIFSSAVAGTATLNCFQCKFSLTSGYVFNLTNWTGKLVIRNCTDASTDNGILYNTASAPATILYSVIGKGTGQTMTANGNIKMFANECDCPILLDGAGVSIFDGACTFTGVLATADTHDLTLGQARFATGALQSITHNSTTTLVMENVIVNNSNADAIGGTGTLQLMGVSFPDSDSLAATLSTDLVGVLRTAEVWADNITRMEGSGFYSWAAAGPYFDDTVLGDFELLIGGTGYIKGRRVTWSGSQTVSSLTAGNTYLIYIDEDGIIGKTTSFTQATFQDYIVLFECMRDSTTGTNNQVTVKENHPYNFSTAVSYWAHEAIGILIENHAGGANITLNGTQKIQINGADDLSDHGLYTDIPDSAGVGVVFKQYFTDGSGKWALYTESDTFNGQWNSAGTATAISNNKYTVSRLYVSKDSLNSATPSYFSVLGDAEYNNIAAAQTAISDGNVPSASGELTKLELAQLGFVIFSEASTSIVDVIIAKQTIGSSTSTSGINTASLVLTDVTNFDGILSAADTNVQAALETIDEVGKSPSFTGTVTAGTGFVATTGDMTVTAGNVALPTTSSTAGQIQINSTRFAHAYGTNNTFLGSGAGNTSLTGVDNTGIGNDSLKSLTSGYNNTAVGNDSLSAATTGYYNLAFGETALSVLTDGNNNTAFGVSSGLGITSAAFNCIFGRLSLYQVTTGSRNTIFGDVSGGNLTGTDSDNIMIGSRGTAGDNHKIIIGTQGSGDAEQNSCYIAGIHNVTPSGATETVIIDSNGQLGSTATFSGFVWNESTGTTQALAVDNGYITNNAAQVVCTLPDTAALGSVIRICGKGAGGWRISQNAGETIIWDETDSTTTGTGGYLASTDDYDAIELLCTVVNVDWTVISSKGNITIVQEQIMATKNSIGNKSQDLTLDPGASGDSFVQFDINGTGKFRVGVDDNAADSEPGGGCPQRRYRADLAGGRDRYSPASG